MWILVIISIAAFLAFFFAFFLYKYFTRNFDYWKKRNVFYIKPVPFLGNLLDLINEPIGLSLLSLGKKVGDKDFYGIFLFDRPILVVKSPKLVQHILHKDSATFIDRTLSSSPRDPVLSNLLFFQKDVVWKDARTKLSPIFTSAKLKLMFPLMMKEGENMTEYITKVVNVPDIESKEICAKFAINVIARCAFAVEANCFTIENAAFRQIGRQLADFGPKASFRQTAMILLPKLSEWLNLSFFDRGVIKPLGDIFMEVLHTRMASKKLKGNDFVDILLEAQRSTGEKIFSNEAMLGQAIQFFGAGFETVASALSFSLYELCVNPEIQEKLRTEILDSIKEHNGITYETLHELKYLDMCLSETLRKYPGAFLDRTCKQDYKIPYSDVVIEKGMAVYIPQFELHYNPKYFPNPEKYDPDRFLDKSSINKDGLWYIPFGDGPRICIGNRFGLMETKVGIVSILSKYRLEVSSKTPIPIRFTRAVFLVSDVGIPLKFVPL